MRIARALWLLEDDCRQQFFKNTHDFHKKIIPQYKIYGNTEKAETPALADSSQTSTTTETSTEDALNALDTDNTDQLAALGMFGNWSNWYWLWLLILLVIIGGVYYSTRRKE